jgi:hypothetical protein
MALQRLCASNYMFFQPFKPSFWGKARISCGGFRFSAGCAATNRCRNAVYASCSDTCSLVGLKLYKQDDRTSA